MNIVQILIKSTTCK